MSTFVKSLLLMALVTFIHQLRADTQIKDLVNHCQIKVVWGAWPPYQYLQDDKARGIQINLIKQIAKAANCDLEFQHASFSEGLDMLKSGQADMTFDTTVTEQRKSYAWFSEPYRNEVLALYVRPQFINACESESVESMVKSGMRLGITRGNLYGDSITRIQNNETLDKKLIYHNHNSTHYDLFIENKLDALVEDPAIMAYRIRKDANIGQLKLCKIAVSSSTVSLMFSKKTIKKSDVERFNEAIVKVKKTQEYKQNWSWN